MKRNFAMLLAAAIVPLALADGQPVRRIDPPVRLDPRVKGARPITPLDPRNPIAPGLVGPRCPDPAAVRIDVRLISRTDRFSGRILIEGIVRNLGTRYESAPNQQIAALYELPPGGHARLVRQVPFQNLNPLEEFKLSYRTTYSLSSEFPPSYELKIVYDPDIRIDNNPSNDDCRGDNNRLTRDAASIRDAVVSLFH